MAKKYLRYLVTRNNQVVAPDMMQEFTQHYIDSTPNVLTHPSVNTWLLDEALKSGFYCNWPNTDRCMYVVSAEVVLVAKECRIEPNKSSSEHNNFFGYYVLNGDNKAKFIFQVDDELAEVPLESGLLLVSPCNGETHKTTYWPNQEPLVMIKFYIKPVESADPTHPWIPF